MVAAVRLAHAEPAQGKTDPAKHDAISRSKVNLVLDETLARSDPALTLHWDFPDIKLGDYVVRLVVREPETKSMTTINRPLKIL